MKISPHHQHAHELAGTLFFMACLVMGCIGLGATALLCILYIENWKIAAAMIGLEILMIVWPAYKTFVYFFWKIVSVK